jgi:hypothetical protein
MRRVQPGDQEQRFISKLSVASGNGSGGWRPVRGVSRLHADLCAKLTFIIVYTFNAVVI